MQQRAKNDTSSVVGWAILVELILRIALAAGPILSSTEQSSIRPAELNEYWKIFPS